MRPWCSLGQWLLGPAGGGGDHRAWFVEGGREEGGGALIAGVGVEGAGDGGVVGGL